MPAKITQKEFVKRCTEKHKGIYSYEKSVYVSAAAKVIVTCKEHGDFLVRANLHMSGTGCSACSGKKKKTSKSFEDEAKLVHGNKFDYSLVDYKNTKTHVTLKCEKGHTFNVLPSNHLRGSSCPICNGKYNWSNAEFINKCKIVHNDGYDYSKTLYKNSSSKVTIICKEHGEFEQVAHMHYNGQGCPKCKGRNKTIEEFILEANKIHNNKYNYSKSVYTGSKQNLTIICKEHGDFEQSPNSHLRGAGCPTCSGSKPYTTESFKLAAIKVHGDKYSYDNVQYGKNNTIPVTITCKVHGDFEQRPMDHLEGCGCQKCNNYGTLEQELRSFIESLGFVTTKDREILDGKEIDIYIPSKKIGFEFNGLFWHSEARSSNPKENHKLKTDLATLKGMRLIHIYEDDWILNRTITENTIKHILGINTNKVYARNCKIVEQSCDEFINDNHMLGKATSISSSITLVHDNSIVAAMQFSKSGNRRGYGKDGSYELIRFASVGVIGAASKLFKYFVSEYHPTEIVSYSDNDMFDGNMYNMLGFKKIADVPPDYKICEGGKRHHKSGYRKERLAARFGERYNPDKTEHENCLDLKLYRVYNSGLKKWLWNNPTKEQ